jgi:hypothetical protein
MPELVASGNVFTLDAGAGFDEGVVRGKVGAGARLSFDARFALCHGLTAGLSAQAVAEAQAALNLFWLLAGRGQGQALAAAGVKVDARINVDLFDEFGLTAEAAAFAEASVAGRLAIGLDFEDIARLAQQQLPGIAYDIFIAFLNELVIEAGVWAKASFAAMAKANLYIRGSLRDDDNAGFIVEMGAEAGWGAGTGYEFFAGLRLDNPKRFYLTATERITQELVREARQLLPAHLQPMIPMLELALPIVLNAAYDLGQTIASEALASGTTLTEPFNDAFLAQLQRFLFDQLAQAGMHLLATVVEDMAQTVSASVLGDAQRTALTTQLEALITDLSGAELTSITLMRSFGAIVDVLSVLRPDAVSDWRGPLTITWTALAAGDALRRAVGTYEASASASLIGLGSAATSGTILYLPDPPQVVRDELETFFEGAPPRIEVRHAVDYLIGSGAAPLLELILPDLALLLIRLSQGLGVTPGALVEAALHGTAGGDLTETHLYLQLRAFVKEAIDGYIVADVMPELRAQMGQNADARLWLDEVAEPSLLMSSSFVFEQLDQFVSGGILRDDYDAFGNTLRTGFSILAGKIIVRNVVVVGDILTSHVIAGLNTGFRALETAVRNDPAHILATAGVTLVPQLLPPLVPQPPNLLEPTRNLVAELAGAGADATSTAVWTAGRRQRFRGLAIRLLESVDGDVDYANGAALESFFKQVFECAYIPDPDGLMQMHALQMEILQAQLDVTLPRISAALGDFFLQLTYETVVALDEAAREFIDAVAATVQAAWEEFQRWRVELERRIAELQAAARTLADQLAVAAALLRSPVRRQEILDRLLLDGIATAEANARSVIGFNLLPRDQQEQAVAVAVGLFVVLFNGVRPALDLGLQALASVADGLSALVNNAADVPDLIAQLVDAAGAAVRDGVNDALGVVGVALPSELSVADVADAAKAALAGLTELRNALAAALLAREAEREAERREREAREQRDAEQARWQEEKAAHAGLLGDAITIQMVSPGTLVSNPEQNWAYGPVVPIRIRVQGARPSYVQPSAPRRIFIAVNGQEVPVNPASWTYSAPGRTLALETSLAMTSAPLQAGLNVLECSVADGQTTIVRERVIFAVNPDAPLVTALEVDSALSTFNTPANDHDETEREHVTFRNTGTLPVNLHGWLLADRVRHRFQFPDVELLPGGTLAVYTGRGTNTDTALYWNRSRAVWNNRGDTVYLIDADRNLRLEHVY